jgi:hypothetical protein
MDKENIDLDKLFKEKLTSERGDHSFSQNDWNLLELKLNLSEKRKRQNVFLFRTLIGAAAVSLISFIIWVKMPNEPILVQPQSALKLNDKEHELSELGHERIEEIKIDIEEVYHTSGNPTNITQDSKFTVFTDKPEINIRNGIYENIKIYLSNNAIKPNLSQNNLLISSLPFSKSNQQNNYINVQDVKSDQAVHPIMEGRKNIMLSILVAPAFNGVNGFKGGEIGGDFGVLFSVDITKKLTLSTGAIYAKKLYETDFNKTIYPDMGRHEYSGGNNNDAGEYIDNTVFPDNVYANCKVLDIPLNINYSLVNKGKNKFSMGTGLSSYIMLKEKYQFEYAENTHINSEKLQLLNENKHIMGILNFQANYSRQLNPKIGVSLQPYLKIPLKNIGYAETKLQSAGMAVSVNLSLNAKH